MSAPAAEPVGDGEAIAPAPKWWVRKKKLVIIGAAAFAVLIAGGGAAAFFLKSGDADDADGARTSHAAAREKNRTPPTFLPLDPFVVNLADRESERFAQIGITLELDDAHFADELKVYMPAIRNGILMVLAHKTSRQLLERAGKEALAREIMREAVRPLGMEFEAEEPVVEEKVVAATPKSDDDDDDEDTPAPKPKSRKKFADHNPVRHVHFSSFIIQ